MLATALVLSLAMNFVGCRSDQQPSTESSQSAPADAQTQPKAAEFTPPPNAPPAPKVDSRRAMQYVREIVNIGPRPVGSKAHEKTIAYILEKLSGIPTETDSFDAQTPAGKFKMTNVISRIPGNKDGVIVLASHFDTNLPLKNYVGANDSGSSTGLLLEIANQLRGTEREGYSVWLVFLDGEEATVRWSPTDSLYGSRHLAQKWQSDGSARKIKAFILLDMVGDADLNIDRDLNSTPWLLDVVYRAATSLGYQSHFFGRQTAIEDDHLPFAKAGIPVADLIDLEYGYNNVFHHTSDDTLDKLSPQSLRIVGDTVLETVRLLDSR